MKELIKDRVFEIFSEIASIPRGSGNMGRISGYCLEFAKANSLCAVKDGAENVIIYKDGTEGYENSEPLIMQGHLDMVCQKDEGVAIDFEKDSLELFADGDFLKAKGTTLGADNGIAVAMILAILERKDISHPPIEAVFTTDEEIGMIGALKLDCSGLKGKKMINIDSEDMEVLTVSCAGGSDFYMKLPISREKKMGTCITLAVKGLQGGHSGVEIHKGRVNANILMGRILHQLRDYELISIDGGDKGNAIPVCSRAKILVKDNTAPSSVKEYEKLLKEELSARESGFYIEIERSEEGEFEIIREKDKLIHILLIAPDGVIQMSAEIENLVETSLNLGILKTDNNSIDMLFTLRSNKKSAMKHLEDRLKVFARLMGCSVETGGYYPPWEFNGNSRLQEIYKKKFAERYGYEPRTEAIHAGLEGGVFSSAIKGLDCISIGPRMYDIHTTKERLSISSTKELYSLLLKILEECK